jgi:RND family efflux transporter MFP subunit
MACDWRKILAPAGLLPLLLAAGCERDLIVPEPPLRVSVFEVGTAPLRQERKIHGKVVPADLTRVSFRTPGKISHLPVQAGQRVVAGQTIARIEDSIQRQVLADARAQYELSKRQLERAENLFKIDAITPSQRDELNAGFRLARARLGLAEAQLSYTLVKAPFEGRVADVEKELFEAVGAGETVASVYRIDRTDVVVDLPDAIPARSSNRDKKSFKTGAVFSGDPAVYTLAYLKNTMARSPESQAFRFWLSMPSGDAVFPPGTPVTLAVNFREAGLVPEAGQLVPLTALAAADQQGQFELWRYRDGQVNPVPVVVGQLSGDGVLVTGDLQAGDLVVTSGLSRLSAGQAVDIQGQAGEPER